MLEYIGLSNEELESIINGVYNGSITKTKLPPELYEAIFDRLTEGVLEGFGEWDGIEGRERILDGFAKNLSVFSAAKTFQQINDLTNFLFTADGQKASFSDFKKAAGEIFEQYNKNWLETEFNTAISQAQAADDWLQVEEDKDIFPLLKYQTVGDDRVRLKHISLDNIVRPVSDPFWDSFYPPNGWNCRCIAIQLEEGEEPVTDLEGLEIENVPKLFQINPAKQKIIFDPKAHPYLKVEDRYKITDIEDSVIRKKTPPPVKKAVKKVEAGGNVFKLETKTQARAAVKEIIEGNSVFKIKNVSFSTALNMEQANKRLDVISDLFKTYKSSEVYNSMQGMTTNVAFKSSQTTYGAVSYRGRNLVRFNFGDKSDPGIGRIRKTRKDFEEIDKNGYLRRFRKSKSSVDESNLEIATTVHEFAHIITMSENRFYSPIDKEFFSKLSGIRSEYYEELNNIRENFQGVELAVKRNEIDLGQYAGTNLDEFLAEGFTEYKLSSEPNKYAKKIGKLVDEYYKR